MLYYTARQGSDETPVSHTEDAMASVCKGYVVGDDDEGDPFFPIETEEELKKAVAGSRVEVAGGFVSENQSGVLHECPRNGNTLLFAAGKFTRPVKQTGR